MKKWEYKAENIPVGDEVITRINREGQNEWRAIAFLRFGSALLSTEYWNVVFEREIPEPTMSNQTDELEEVRRLLNAPDSPQKRMDKIRRLLGLKVPEAQPTGKTADGLDSPPGNE